VVADSQRVLESTPGLDPGAKLMSASHSTSIRREDL
jgi:hypothetical protein